MKLIIQRGEWAEYHRFVNLCCVENLPQMAGVCYTARLMNDDETAIVHPDVAFIGYNYPFRHSHVRLTSLPELRQMNNRRRLCYINHKSGLWHG